MAAAPTVATESRGNALALERVHKRYGTVRAVEDVSLAVPQGALLTLLGPSGCGKTTLLRIIAGFVAADRGRILIDGADIGHQPPEARGIGMVFQNYALFPHLSLARNLGFGLRMRRLSRAEINRRVAAMIELVRLDGLADRYPSQLSGGQQQRAALGRALVIEPRVLLLDEPLAALDRNLRDEMQGELRGLQQRLGITSVVVTHDHQEALFLSDLIAVLRDGRVEQFGAPLDIYDRPDTVFVARFMGFENLIPARVEQADGRRCRVRLMPSHEEVCGISRASVPVGSGVSIAVRPRHVHLIPDSGANTGLAGSVVSCSTTGDDTRYRVAIGGSHVVQVQIARRDGLAGFPPGAVVRLVFPPERTVVLPAG